MNRSFIIKLLITIVLLGSTTLDAMTRKSGKSAVKEERTQEATQNKQAPLHVKQFNIKEPDQAQTIPVWLQTALVAGAEPINFHEILKTVKIPDVYYDETLGFLQLQDQQTLFENKINNGKPDSRGLRRFDYYALSKQTWADKPVMVFYALRVKADFAGEDFLVPGVGVKGFILVFQGHDEKFFLNRQLFKKDFFEDSIGYCNVTWHAMVGQHGGINIDILHGDEKYEKKDLKGFIFEKLLETLQGYDTSCFWISLSDERERYEKKMKSDYISFFTNVGFKWRLNVVNDATSGLQHHIFPEGTDWLYVMKRKRS